MWTETARIPAIHAPTDEPPTAEMRLVGSAKEETSEADLAWLLDDPYLAVPRSAWLEEGRPAGGAAGRGAFGHHVLPQLHARLETERISAGLPASGEIWERHREAEAFDRDGPPVRMRAGIPDHRGVGQSPDIRLVLAGDLPSGATDPELDVWAWRTFGTDWDAPGPVTDTLSTRFEDRMIPRPGDAPRFVRHLNHQDFAQVFRVESQAASPRLVTFRVFLALADRAEDPSMWMRLDTFQQELEPGPNVVIRPARRSSMLQKDARGCVASPPRPPGPADRPGWPYHLLLPRGSTAGTRFRLLVLLTEDEGAAAPGSRRDAAAGGPRDPRPPTFPFCHRFPDGIEQTIGALDHAALRDVVIRHCPSGRWPS